MQLQLCPCKRGCLCVIIIIIMLLCDTTAIVLDLNHIYLLSIHIHLLICERQKQSIMFVRYYITTTAYCFCFKFLFCYLLQGRTYFFQDYVGKSLNPAVFWTQPEFKDMITIHPVKQPDNIRALHLFYKSLDYENAYRLKKDTETSLTHLCNTLPTNLVPPSYKKSNCNIEFSSSHYYEEGVLSKPPKLHHHHKSP